MFDQYIIFTEYPDIISVQDLMEMLHISKTTAYRLLHNREIFSFKIGDKYKIPKESVIDYLNEQEFSN